MDGVDLKLIGCLKRQGRMTWAELAIAVGLSAPATAERVKRLEERGIIRGYAAILNSKAIGLPLAAIVCVTLNHPKNRQAFIDKVATLETVEDCHHITGDHDYLLKIRCRDTDHLDDLLNEIKAIVGVAATRTTIILKTFREASRDL